MCSVRPLAERSSTNDQRKVDARSGRSQLFGIACSIATSLWCSSPILYRLLWFISKRNSPELVCFVASSRSWIGFEVGGDVGLGWWLSKTSLATQTPREQSFCSLNKRGETYFSTTGFAVAPAAESPAELVFPRAHNTARPFKCRSLMFPHTQEGYKSTRSKQEHLNGLLRVLIPNTSGEKACNVSMYHVCSTVHSRKRFDPISCLP